MNINDYLITSANLEWPRLLADWVPPLPARFNVWLVNRLGEAFVVTDTDAVLRLDVGSGVCEPVARDRAQFAQLLDTGNTADRWFRVSLVDACRRSGMTLKNHECYGFRIPPTLGGRYEVANLMPVRLEAHYSYQAYICKQADIYWVPPL